MDRQRWDARRVVLGDWTPAVRDGIDLVRLVLVATAVVLLVRGRPGLALFVGLLAGLTLLARVINLPRLYDACFTAGMAFQAFGEVLNYYDRLPVFDDIVHVTLPLLTAPVLYIGLARLDVVPDPRDETHLQHYLGIFVMTAALGVTIGALWEIVEWRSDAWLGTDLQEGNADTVGDLLSDTVGSLVGAALLVVWTRYGWGSVRRIPGVNSHEDVDA